MQVDFGRTGVVAGMMGGGKGGRLSGRSEGVENSGREQSAS